MNKEELLEAVLASDELPTLPTVASKLISLTSREDTTLTDIAELISKDISLSSKILKVSNSAFYSFPQQIGSINQAVSILGTNAVRSLVLSFSFLIIKSGSQKSRFDFQKFWERSLASAVISKLILDRVKGADTEEIFISGLLQNLGQLIFARTFPEQYDRVLAETSESKTEPLIAERNEFGEDHCYIGYKVAKNWGFPSSLLLPILYHHDPEGYSGKDKKVIQTSRAVYLSDLLIGILHSDRPDKYHKQFKKEATKLLSLTSEQIEEILSDVHHHVEHAGKYFGLKIKNTKPISDILQEANIRLSLLNLDYDQMNKQLIQAKIALENLTSELEEKNRILDNLANVDGLTEVFNHRYFQHTLEQEISRSNRHATFIALILIDIDHFKKFNDTYGHQTGDFVLHEFCKVLKANLRQYDTLARYGGEEFVVILPETSEEDAVIVAEKLRETIDSTVFKDDRDEYRVTASFGVSACKPAVEDEFSQSEFINRADIALYGAKAEGRNRVVRYAPKKKWYKF